jgi:hypothetical protein
MSRVTMICATVADGPAHIPDSVERACALCTQGVWVSPASLEVQGGDLNFVCVVCAPQEIATNPDQRVLPPTEAQKREVREHWRPRD